MKTATLTTAVLLTLATAAAAHLPAVRWPMIPAG